ncbi:MAG: hypothetical protein LR008_00020 [Candidatus Pacebacteria bacterium]|nr:hypothetical protein [Candidatus Paceibacterota bacterium]
MKTILGFIVVLMFFSEATYAADTEQCLTKQQTSAGTECAYLADNSSTCEYLQIAERDGLAQTTRAVKLANMMGISFDCNNYLIGSRANVPVTINGHNVPLDLLTPDELWSIEADRRLY